MSSAPLGCGLLAAQVSNSVYPANISHPGHFQPAFPYSSVCLIEVCICLFSAAVPWAGGAGDAAVEGVQPSAVCPSPCSASLQRELEKPTPAGKWLRRPAKSPSMGPAWGCCFADVHRDPPGAGIAGDQGSKRCLTAPVAGVGASVCQCNRGPCWIEPTQICTATASACGAPKWEIGLALFLLPSFNSECRLLKAIWAGPGNVEML